MISTNDCYNLVETKDVRLVPRQRKKAESFVTDGILSSFETIEDFNEFGDEHSHFRDLSLRSIIKAEAVDLLKPLGALPYDMLRAADKLGEFTGSLDDFGKSFDVFKANLNSSPSVVAPDATLETK